MAKAGTKNGKSTTIKKNKAAEEKNGADKEVLAEQIDEKNQQSNSADDAKNKAGKNGSNSNDSKKNSATESRSL